MGFCKRKTFQGLLPILLMCAVLVISCSRSVKADEQTQGESGTVSDEMVGVPNPAADFCEDLGYKWEMKGGVGTCIFPDDSECEGWKFYRGECGKKFSYCVKQGASIRSQEEDMGGWTAKYAVCVFDDKSECLQTEFMSGKCDPGKCKKWIASKGGCLTHIIEIKKTEKGKEEKKSSKPAEKKAEEKKEGESND